MRDRRANEATSEIAVWSRILISISEGRMEIGHGGVGDASVAGSVAGMERDEKDAMSCGTEETRGRSKE